MNDESENKTYLYLAVPSIPASLILACSWACTCYIGFRQHVLGVSYGKDIGGKIGGDMIHFLKDQLQSAFKTVKALRVYAAFM